MISFKQGENFVEVPKKLNIAPSHIDETIPNEDFHFYRFFVTDDNLLEESVRSNESLFTDENYDNEDFDNVFLEDNVSQDLHIDNDELQDQSNESATSESVLNGDISEKAPVSPLAGMSELARFCMLIDSPDFSTASFLRIKLWTVMHMHYRTGIDYKDLLSMRNQDVDFEKETFIITLKNTTRLSFTLHSELIPILEAYMERRKGRKDDFLFCNEQGQELSLMALLLQLSSLFKQYDLDYLSDNEMIKLYRNIF